MKHFAFCVCLAGAALLVPGCGDSPTEPSAAPLARTTLRITVTACSLGGTVVVQADGTGNEPATLATPGEVTLKLTPGPHSLSFRRGDHVFSGNTSGTLDPLGSIPAGATTSILLVDPPAACMATPSQ